ncbi:PTS system, ascorbate-specific IIA component [Lentibacillus halodurans]|uniref:PTS system, ascorbate-specific IIA component n=1 Tax=Lentibacillus halodurans TaxID=237679 RepID=A0A1I0XG85_9BACI|nr:PTS sugar transporter subunit IIA [Lentibacillus halodurans]SFB00001.1 PTS system, ascorbate-specific IIA component [Lentibacillus halodurans]
MKFLDRNMIKIGAEAQTAEDAIEEAGKVLFQEGAIEATYVDAMIDAYKENGPYFVLAPYIAIPHARPEDGVKEASVSLVQLKHPVKFGHQTNDPVQLVFGLGAASSDEHLTLLKKLTGLLNDKNNVEALINIDNLADIQKIIEMER